MAGRGYCTASYFEIISPSNTAQEMARKLRFFQRYGVQEYYVYDPEDNVLDIWLRGGDHLINSPSQPEWISPLLGVKFVRSPEGLTLYHPDGKPFTSYQEECDRAEKLAAKLRKLGIDPDTLT